MDGSSWVMALERTDETGRSDGLRGGARRGGVGARASRAPRAETAQRQRNSGVDEDGAAQRDETGDRLAEEAQDLAGVGEAEKRAQLAAAALLVESLVDSLVESWGSRNRLSKAWAGIGRPKK